MPVTADPDTIAALRDSVRDNVEGAGVAHADRDVLVGAIVHDILTNFEVRLMEVEDDETAPGGG